MLKHLLLSLIFISPLLTAQEKSINVYKLSVDEKLAIDGKLNDEIWTKADIATNFIQRFPIENAPSSLKTEAKILLSEDAIIIGIMAHDTNTDSLIAPLFRRDSDIHTDWISVFIDSYNDNRTAFAFAVNPKGVQRDFIIYDDIQTDDTWNAVWKSETVILEDGWSVEISIPLTQLRYSTKNETNSWGINFSRFIARKNEASFWTNFPLNSTRRVSLFGDLNGLSELPNSNRLEITPFLSGSITENPNIDLESPYYDDYLSDIQVGTDVKFGLTSDLTLTATLNPDFGQVEADPAQINLTQFELFFPERRPFFLEGNEIFNFGGVRSFISMGNPFPFYSRRVGRSPQGSLSNYLNHEKSTIQNNLELTGTYSNPPDQTSIITAAKLTGKTNNGWTIGILNAVTPKEKSPYFLETNDENSIQGSFLIEPPTNYFVNRNRKDINNGNTILGTYFGSTIRKLENSYLSNYLHKSATLGGLDFEHNWSKQGYTVSGAFSFAHVTGKSEALLITQQSPTRYMQRIDSDYLKTDSSRTSLTGLALALAIRKSNDSWNWSVAYTSTSPSYEANDMGFQNRADYHGLAYAVVKDITRNKYFRIIQLRAFALFAINYDGNLIRNNYTIAGSFEFKNQFGINSNLSLFNNQLDDRLTRGGPITKYPRRYATNISFNTNPSKNIVFRIATDHSFNIVGEHDHYYSFRFDLRPLSSLQMSFAPGFSKVFNDDQYIGTYADRNAINTYNNRYVFSSIEQNVLSSSFRLNWTFSPNLSLQTYLRPYISSVNYSDFKELTDPKELEFKIYGQDKGVITNNGNGDFTVDPDTEGGSDTFSFNASDFKYSSLQGNMVLRWEYKPGSAFFLVWQRSSDTFSNQYQFDTLQDIRTVFSERPTNIFLIKFSYWLSK